MNAPVTDLAATSGGETSIVLSWTAPAGAARYNVQGAPNGTTWGDIGSTDKTTYLIVDLPPGEQYWARIFPENAGGQWGEASNVASATTGAVPSVADSEPFTMTVTAEPGDGERMIFVSSDAEVWISSEEVNVITPRDAGHRTTIQRIKE